MGRGVLHATHDSGRAGRRFAHSASRGTGRKCKPRQRADSVEGTLPSRRVFPRSLKCMVVYATGATICSRTFRQTTKTGARVRAPVCGTGQSRANRLIPLPPCKPETATARQIMPRLKQSQRAKDRRDRHKPRTTAGERTLAEKNRTPPGSPPTNHHHPRKLAACVRTRGARSSAVSVGDGLVDPNCLVGACRASVLSCTDVSTSTTSAPTKSVARSCSTVLVLPAAVDVGDSISCPLVFCPS